ncbi:glycerol kinase GlpK [Myxococcota bacterium]
MNARQLLAIDQGTTGTTVLVVGLDGSTLGRATRKLGQHYPEPGWVEHDPEEIWDTVLSATGEALSSAGIQPTEVGAIGITNQRETVVGWDTETGQPVYRAIVWQDRRTADLCADLTHRGYGATVQKTTGLLIDPYFSATKLSWLLDHVPDLRERSQKGLVALGTIDSLLAYRLAGGAAARAPIVTDVTNASRTLLMNLRKRAWDPAMCELFRVPPAALPRIVPTAGVVARTRCVPGLPDGLPITAMVGDQQAALFGQGCFEPGDAKCTYGTGAFVLVNTGSEPILSRSHLLTTVAWQIGSRIAYALEGSAFMAGAAVDWLRDGLGLVSTSAEVEWLARCVDSSLGTVFVPALTGLGAPHWDPNARGLIMGLTRGTTAAHLARATLEAIALQVDDLVSSMAQDLGRPCNRMRVDGGAAANDLLMELQSDFSALTVERPIELESTARGAAMLAGIGAGLFANDHQAANLLKIERVFCPAMGETERLGHQSRWQAAVRRASSREGQV